VCRMLCNLSVRICGLVTVAAATLLWFAPAHAGEMMTETCVGTGGTYSCFWHDRDDDPYVRHVSPPRSDKEIAESAERDRLWAARCRPVVRPDAYGVGRYRYAAPGCEFGRYE
jgi:hypothetical protein